MNPLLQVSEQEIESLDEHQFTDIMNRLLKAEAQRYGIPPLAVKTTLRVHDPDGGIDARVEHSVSVPAQCRIPEGVSVWQYKAGQAGPAAIKQESEKPGVQEAIKAGGYYYFAIGQGCGDKARKKRETAVNDCFVQEGLEPKGELLTAQDIADWVSDHPPVAMHPYFGRPIDDRLYTFEGWSRLPQLRVGYLSFEADEEREAIIDALRGDISGRTGFNSFFLGGRPGVGKTRLALEGIRALSLADETLYVSEPDGIPPNLFSYIESHPRIRLTLVVDECTFDQALLLHDRAHRCGERLLLIIVGHEPERPAAESSIPVFWLGGLEAEALGKIVQKMAPTMPPQVTEFVVQGSGGYVKLATAMTESLARNPGLVGAAQLAGAPDVRVILESLVPDPRVRQAMGGLSLMRHVGLDEDVADEGRVIAAFVTLDFGEFKQIAERMRRTGLVVKRGRYRYVSPHLLAVWFAAEVWRARGEDIVNDLLLSDSGLPTFESKLALLERLADLGEEEVAGPIVERMLGPGGLFPDIHELDDPLRSRVFAALAKAAPEPGAAALERIIGHLPRDSLLEFREGRRQIVWLLEGLLSLEETFWTAARLLLKLAEAENETFANNAAGTWREIFYTHLGPTPVPAIDRHTLIAEALDSGMVETRLLAVQALRVALSSRESRVEGPGLGGHIKPPEWRPRNWGELWEVRRSALGLLDRALVDEEPRVSKAAKEVLFRAARGLVRQGLAEDLLSKLKGLPVPNDEERLRMWELLQAILFFENKALTEEQRAFIEQWSAELRDDSYHERLRRWVGRLSSPDYKKLRDSGKTARDVAAELAEEGFQTPDQLRSELEWLASPNAVEFYAFGRRLGQLDVEREWLRDLVAQSRSGGNPGLLTAYLQGRDDSGESEWVEQLLDQWSEDDEGLASATFDATWRRKSSDRGAERITSLVDKGWLPAAQLGGLGWGGWAEGISADAVASVLQRLVQDESPVATEGGLLLLLRWLETHRDEADVVAEYALQLLERPSALRSEGMIAFYWQNVAECYVPNFSGRLAQAVLGLFEDPDYFAIQTDEQMQVLQAAIVRDPETVWPLIGAFLLRGDEASYRLRLSMRDWGLGGVSVPLLLGWADEHLPEGPRTLAGMAHVGSVPLNPLARELLIRYGEDESIGGMLAATFLSGTFWGSEAAWFRSKIEVARNWLDDDSKAVRGWARELVQSIEEDIKRAARSEEEEELRWL